MRSGAKTHKGAATCSRAVTSRLLSWLTTQVRASTARSGAQDLDRLHSAVRRLRQPVASAAGMVLGH